MESKTMIPPLSFALRITTNDGIQNLERMCNPEWTITATHFLCYLIIVGVVQVLI